MSGSLALGSLALEAGIAGGCCAIAESESDCLISDTAAAPINPAKAMARKFCSKGNCIEINQPISTGATIAPVRPMPEANPTPVARMVEG